MTKGSYDRKQNISRGYIAEKKIQKLKKNEKRKYKTYRKEI